MSMGLLSGFTTAVSAQIPQPAVDRWLTGTVAQIQTEPTKLLIRACGSGDPPAAFRLLRKVTVDINARDTKDKKRSALHQVAARTGAAADTSPDQQLQCLRQLIAAGATPGLKDADGRTAEELAGAEVWSQLKSK